MLITLASGTDFKLDGNVLTENRLNRIKIQGSDMDSGHVEIAKNAFNNNSGPFPDIEIVNVESVIIQSHAFYRKYHQKLHEVLPKWLRIASVHVVSIFNIGRRI